MTTDTVTVEQAAPTVQPASKAIDFAKVDALRRHMLLTVDSMAALLGASRVSYYNWLKGTLPKGPRTKRLREEIRRLVTCVSQHGWPGPAVFVATQEERLEMLQSLLKDLDKTPIQQ